MRIFKRFHKILNNCKIVVIVLIRMILHLKSNQFEKPNLVEL